MANTLTVLKTNILVGALSTLREEFVLASILPKDFRGVSGRKGDTVSVSMPIAQTTGDITPSPTAPAFTDTTPTEVTFQLDSWKSTRFHLTAKEADIINENAEYVPPQIAEAARAIMYDINADIFSNYKYIYGFTGTPATDPFASNIDPVADLDNILNGQKCPYGNRQLVIDNDSRTAALKLAEFKQFQLSGDNIAFRNADLGRLYGFQIWNDRQVPSHTAGTGSGYLVDNGAGYAAGTKTLTIDTGSGTFVEGDIVTFAGHTQSYVVVSGTTTELVLYNGLESSVVDDEAITIKATHACNLGFDPAAFALAMRIPDESLNMGLPVLGEHMAMTDPATGIPLRLSYYPGYHGGQWELSALWGSMLVDNRRAARLAG